MWATFAFLVLMATLTRSDTICPPMVCSCQDDKSANCSSRGLVKAPPGLPQSLKNLDLSKNDIDAINSSQILAMADLEILDLSSNILTQLRFTGTHYKLRKLDLSSNNFTTVRSLQLEGLVHLTELNLANNNIMSLPSNAFPGGSFLRTLNLKNNRLGFLDEGCLSSLTNLETLILTRNALSSFPTGIFQKMESLQILEVNKNKFKEIQSLTFHGLENLRILRLKRNQIDYLGDAAFFGLNSIEELSLDRNKVNRVNKGWLYGLTTLRYLSLSHNHVDFVDDDAWEFCHALDELDLRANKLQLLDRITLSRLPSLRHLYLQDNKISHIEGGANNDEAKTFADVPLLETLALDGNELSHTIEDMEAPFHGLSNLKSLSLSNNLVKSVGNRAFLGLDSLEMVDLRDNVISTVQENAFGQLPRLQSLLINSGSLLCDCYLKWFPKWLNDTSGLHRSHVTATCAHPEQLKGQMITFVPYESYTCEDFPKPYLLTQPQTQVTQLGDNLKLTCRAASTSPADMKFLWKVDSDIVEASEEPDCTERCIRYLPHSFDGKGREMTAELHLTNLTYDDAGRYQCVVSNRFGVTYSDRANITVYVYPTFVVTPEDIVVEAGSSATMKCAAKGVPAPQVSWAKDFNSEFPAAKERRIMESNFQPDDDRLTSVNSFIMRDIKGQDMGMYTCTAKNPAGTISWNISFSVLETPKFVKPMESKIVTEGETAVMECHVSGSPKPQLSWSKDGVKLETTAGNVFAVDGRQLLIIVKARMTDSGEYQCTVSNPLGTLSQSGQLTVQPFNTFPAIVNGNGNKNSGEHGPQSAQTIIIITVIVSCCILALLVIWLVVSVFCRRHGSRQSSMEHGRRPPLTTGGGGGGARIGKTDMLPLTPDTIPLQKPLVVVANQYTDHLPRRGSTNPLPPIPLMVENNGSTLRNIIQHDSSSERDSGTGDSRKSRDNLDEDEVLMSPIVAKVGAGESTISMTDFEDTNLTRLDYEEDEFDDEDEEEETGCGEAMLSASNSVNSDDLSETYSESVTQNNPKIMAAEIMTPPDVNFRTFHPHRSLSRDFLNDHQVSKPLISTAIKKRASAIELNGEKYLVIEREEESPSKRIDPAAYRGGAALSSTSPFLKGLAVNEKLLEYSLNSTDYSLHESQLRPMVRNGRQPAKHNGSSFVNSLPRRSRRHRKAEGQEKNKKQLKKKTTTAAEEEELYTNVPLKDDKLF